MKTKNLLLCILTLIIFICFVACSKLNVKLSESYVRLPNESKMNVVDYMGLPIIMGRIASTIPKTQMTIDSSVKTSDMFYIRNMTSFINQNDNFVFIEINNMTLNIDSHYPINSNSLPEEKWWQYSFDNVKLLVSDLKVISANWSKNDKIDESVVNAIFEVVPIVNRQEISHLNEGTYSKFNGYFRINSDKSVECIYLHEIPIEYNN